MRNCIPIRNKDVMDKRNNGMLSMKLLMHLQGRSTRFFFLLGLIFHLSTHGVSGLRGVQITVPEAVPTGDLARLKCDYDLEQAALYTIKWYKGDEEFYRFVPKESPPTRVFPLNGIHVDISQSNARTVALRDVRRNLTGFYKCEVSADAPLFHTEIKSGLMIVVDIPEGDPSLFTEKHKYSIGEKIRANCTSKASYPAANLTWFVNGQQIINFHQATIFPSVVHEVEGMEITQTSVELEATSDVFREGKLRLRCLATIFTLYRRSEEVELIEDTPHLAPVMGPTAPHSLGTVTYSFGRRMESTTSLMLILSSAIVIITNAR